VFLVAALLLAGCQNGLTGNVVKNTAMQTERVTCSRQRVVLIKGQSMEPTLHDGENVTGLIGYYACHEPARGDIVLFRMPDGFGVKRIAGIPGDTWRVEERTLYLNNEVAERNNRAYAITPKMERFLQQYTYFNPLPAEHYFLLADYTGNALDSRRIGIVAKNDIVGKIEEAST